MSDGVLLTEDRVFFANEHSIMQVFLNGTFTDHNRVMWERNEGFLEFFNFIG